MNRLKVILREEAIEDLAEIYRHIARVSGSSVTAIRFIRRIRRRCERIGNAPFGGRSRDDLEVGLRAVPFEHTAVITYKIEGDYVRVTNVFYGGRDYEALYRRRGSKPDQPEP
jgi:toxin ParE1/3/4